MWHKTFFNWSVFLLIFTCAACHPSPSSENQQDQDIASFKNKNNYTELKNKTSRPKSFLLPDSNRVILDSLSSLKVGDSLHQKKHLFKLNGKAHFLIKKGSPPILIFTGMMKLETQAVDFKITAYHDSPGQSLKVFDGRLIATKSYQSDFPNTDTLVKGEMILINRDIDLMEKETFDTLKTSTTQP